MKSLHEGEMDKARKLALSICIWRVSGDRCVELFLLFPFRFFLLCSGSLGHTGHALIVDLVALLRIFAQRRLQALADDVLVRS